MDSEAVHEMVRFGAGSVPETGSSFWRLGTPDEIR